MNMSTPNRLLSGGNMDKNEINRKAEILKALAHPDRLCILQGLHMYRCNVGVIQSKLGLSQSGLSQHISKLKSVGVIRGERNGKEICYRVVDDFAMEIVGLVFNDMDCEMNNT
jgi:ArsR family transcriptional regulator